MDGSLTSNPRRRLDPRGLLILLVALAMIAAACGGASTDAASATNDAASTTTNTAPDTTSPQVRVADADVLAFAVQASEDTSYSFEQGVSLSASAAGMALDIAPDGPIASGVINGDDSVVHTDAGAFISGMFDSIGIDPALFGVDLSDAAIDVWTVDNVMVIDMSAFVGSTAALDPGSATDLAIFADGPVAIDLVELAELSNFGDADAATIVQQFGGGASINDPAMVIEALRVIDALEPAGSNTVSGTPVDVFEAVVPMADFLDALDIDVDDQLSGLDLFGGLDDTAGADDPVLDDAREFVDDLEVELVVMLDADGLVRRIESTLDLGAVMASTQSSDFDGLGLGEVDAVVESWQTFADYGDEIDIVLPDAPDRTSELANLLGGR